MLTGESVNRTPKLVYLPLLAFSAPLPRPCDLDGNARLTSGPAVLRYGVIRAVPASCRSAEKSLGDALWRAEPFEYEQREPSQGGDDAGAANGGGDSSVETDSGEDLYPGDDGHDDEETDQ